MDSNSHFAAWTCNFDASCFGLGIRLRALVSAASFSLAHRRPYGGAAGVTLKQLRLLVLTFLRCFFEFLEPFHV